MVRFINHKRGDAANVLFVSNGSKSTSEETFAYVVAKRYIKSGEELFADYGSAYWEVPPPTAMHVALE